MKKSFPHKKVWFWVILAAAFLLLGTVCVLAEDIGGLIALALAVLLLSIFQSKRAGERLRNLRRTYSKALREEETAPFISLGQVIELTLRMMLPFYAVWLLAGMMGAFGGYEAWLITSFPVLLLSLIPMSLISGTWRELKLRRSVFWGMQGGCNVLSFLPGMMIALI